APGNLRVRSLAPDAAAWTPLPDIPSAQSSEPLALTAGRALLVLAGPGQPAVYAGLRDGWRQLPAGGRFSASDHTAVWTGQELIVLGASDLPGIPGTHPGRAFRFAAPDPRGE
ncbi:MAG TPA: hypothetical protein VML96_05295, partial [Egibacteraceae bacterium]|nr:hypothetical protein [Egibacteraceae bacterium]